MDRLWRQRQLWDRQNRPTAASQPHCYLRACAIGRPSHTVLRMLRVLSCRGREYSLTVGRSISRVLTVYSVGKSPGPAGHIAAKQHARFQPYDRMHRTHHSPSNVQLAPSLRCSISSQQRSLVAASTSRSATHGIAARPPGPILPFLHVPHSTPRTTVRTYVRTRPTGRAALHCTADRLPAGKRNCA
jgi:hypothetical protein